MRLTVERKVLAGVIAVLLLMAGIGLVSSLSIHRLTENTRHASDSLDVRRKSLGLLLTMVNLETGTRGYVITGDNLYLDPYRDAVDGIPQQLSALSIAIGDAPERKQRFIKLDALVNAELAIEKRHIALRQKQELDAVLRDVKSGAGKREMDQIRAVVADIVGEQDDIMARQDQQAVQLAQRSTWTIGIGGMCGFFFVAAFGVVVHRDLGRRKEAAGRIEAQAAELLQARDELERRVQERTAALERTTIDFQVEAAERRRVEAALLEAGALQSAIFNSANFSSIATDAKGVIQIFNVGAERMLGYTAADVMNKITPAELSDPQELIARANALSVELGASITPGFEALVFKASRGIEDIYELTYVRKDGTRFPAVVSVTALRDANDAIIGYLLIGTDNTARKLAEEALLKAGALQSAIFNSANFSSIATDAKGVIQIFNVGAERMLGYAAADVMNKITPADISDPREVIARAAALSQELQTTIAPGFEALVFKASRGIEDIYELTYIRKDGSRFPALVSVTALRDAQNEIIGYLLIGTDNTARKQAELAAVLLAAVVESSSDAVIGLDLERSITGWNAAAERIFGYSADEIVGRPVGSIIPPDHCDEEEQLLSRIMSGERVEHFETERLRKDGTRINVSVTVTPIKDAYGQVIGASKLVRDITERKRAAEVIRQLNTDLERRVAERTAQLQTANKELEAFSYSVSHDLRAPLRSLDGFSKALMEDCADKLDAEGLDNLQRIRKASQRMGQLIDDLLNLSRLTRVEMTRQTVDLSKMAHEIADDLCAGDPKRKANFAIAEGLVAEADPQLIRIGLTNLLSNAWKFSSKSADARIEFGCAGENGDKAFFVRDNGVGFDMAHAAKLFGAFQRLHAMNDFPGTGIGLTTVQRIVHRHGGRIWAESALDAGAMFSFTL